MYDFSEDLGLGFLAVGLGFRVRDCLGFRGKGLGCHSWLCWPRVDPSVSRVLHPLRGPIAAQGMYPYFALGTRT